MDAVPKISDMVTHYASHRLLSNVHFSSIEEYAVNENRSIHHLYGSGPQLFFADEISGGTG